MKPSRVEKIVFLYSRSSGSRERRVIDTLNGYCRFSGRRLERGRAKAWKILLHGMNRWQVLNRNYEGPTHRRKPIGETNDDIVCAQPARWPAAPIYFLAVVTNDWQLSMLSLAYQQHRPENRQIRGETGTSKRELAIVHTRVDPSHDYSLSAVQRLHGPPFSTAQTLR